MCAVGGCARERSSEAETAAAKGATWITAWCGRVMCALSVDGDTRKEGSTKAER